MRFAADERLIVDGIADGWRGHPLDTKTPHHFGTSRTRSRFGLQKVGAEVLQMRGNIGGKGRGTRCASNEIRRKDTDHGHVQDNAKAVPIAGFSRRFAGQHFRRHIGRRAGQRDAVDGAAIAFADEAEIQQTNPAIGRDQHVAGFDVAVKNAAFVQGRMPWAS